MDALMDEIQACLRERGVEPGAWRGLTRYSAAALDGMLRAAGFRAPPGSDGTMVRLLT